MQTSFVLNLKIKDKSETDLLDAQNERGATEKCLKAKNKINLRIN